MPRPQRYNFQKKYKHFLSSCLSIFFEIDWLLLILIVSLTSLGGLTIKSTEINETSTNYLHHLLSGSIGFVIMLSIARFNYKNLMIWHWLIYCLTNVVLIAVIVFGVTANGAQSWIEIWGCNIQPSEFAKIGLIITLAALLHKNDGTKIVSVLQILGITFIPWVLIMCQPDLGTGLVFGAITLGMLYWANIHTGLLILLVSPIISTILFNIFFIAWIVWTIVMGIISWVTLPYRFISTIGIMTINFTVGKLSNIFWELLRDYQKDRLTLFLEPEKNPLGGGYQLIQSRIAIGSGELWGRGLFQGTQTQLDFVPEQHTDFIFSVIGEEFGFIGSIVILIIFWLICFRYVVVASKAKENFGSLLVIGVLSMTSFQVIINICMTVGLAPITGIPLPWLSYGKSALLTNFIALGLVESVSKHRQRKRL